MKIPVGNFGNALPNQVQARNVGQGTSGIIAQGLGQLADTASAIDERNTQQIEQEEVRKKVLINREYEQQDRIHKLKAENNLSSTMLDIGNQATLIKQQVLNGAKTRIDADKEIQDLADTQWQTLERDMPFKDIPEFKTRYQGQIDGQRATLMPISIRAGENAEMVLIEQSAAINSRNPDRKLGTEAFTKTLQNSNISNAKKSEWAFAFVGTQDKTELNARLLQARDAQDITVIDEMLSDLNSDKTYRGLDAKTIDAYKAQAMSLRSQLTNAAQLQVAKQSKVAETTSNQFVSNVLTGQLIAPEEIDRVRQQVAGTDFAPVVDNYLKSYAGIQRFKDLPIAEQESEFATMEALRKNTPSSNPKAQEAIHNAYKQAMTEKKAMAASNPVSYVAEQGLYKPEPINALAILTPDGGKQVASIVADRVQTLIAAQQKDPSIGLNPLQESELQGVKQVFSQMNSDQKLQFFGQMVSELKHVPQGAKAYGSFLGQVAGSDNLLRLAGMARYRNLRGDQGTDVATTILKGQEIIKSKATILPRDNALLVAFNDYVGNAITGSSRADAFETYKAIHAGLAFDKAVNYTSPEELVDESLSNSALSLATGGIYDQGKKQGYSDWKVLMPYGWDEDKFEDAIQAKLPALANQGVAVSVLEDLPLLQAPGKEGRYYFLDGMRPLLNKQGKPIILEVK